MSPEQFEAGPEEALVKDELRINAAELFCAITDQKDRPRDTSTNLQGRFWRFKEFCFDNPGARISRCRSCFRLVAVVTGARKDLIKDLDGRRHSETCPRHHKGETDQKREERTAEVQTKSNGPQGLF